MSEISNRTKHKAQIYDVALNAFFKARDFDAESLDTPKTDIGWDIAEAMVAAAISGVTYKSRNPEKLADAAMMLRGLADQVEQDGLASLEWGSCPSRRRRGWAVAHLGHSKPGPVGFACQCATPCAKQGREHHLSRSSASP